MAHLLSVVIGVGVVDSANPSTIVPALYLAAGRHAVRSLVGFITGVFVTSLAAGVVIALGPGKAIMSALPHPGESTRHLIELAAGGFAILLSAVLWLQRERVAHQVTTNAEKVDRNAVFFGAGIVLVELPTAIPYFAVIATVVGSDRAAATQVALLAIFNLCFVLPLLGILALRTLAGVRALGLLARMRSRVDAWLATLAPALVLLVGLVLVGIGAYGLLTD